MESALAPAERRCTFTTFSLGGYMCMYKKPEHHDSTHEGRQDFLLFRDQPSQRRAAARTLHPAAAFRRVKKLAP